MAGALEIVTVATVSTTLNIISHIVSTQPPDQLARSTDSSIKSGGILTLQEMERKVGEYVSGAPGPPVRLLSLPAAPPPAQTSQPSRWLFS